MRFTPSSSDSDSIGAPSTTTRRWSFFLWNSERMGQPPRPYRLGIPREEALDAFGEPICGELLDDAGVRRVLVKGRDAAALDEAARQADAAAVRDQ